MCCLFGIIDYKNKIGYKERKRILRNLSICGEERGTDAAGIAFNSSGKLNVIKYGVPAHCLKYNLPRDTFVVMGHNRLATQGSADKVYNNQPFQGVSGNNKFAFAHNGIIYNDKLLRKELNLPDTKIETDSFIAVQLIENKGAFDIDAIKYAAENVEGSFCFTFIDSEDSIYIVKGNNPMVVFDYKFLGICVYASTAEILKKAVNKSILKKQAYEEIKIGRGEIIKINRFGEREHFNFDTKKLDNGIYSYGGMYGSIYDDYMWDIYSGVLSKGYKYNDDEYKYDEKNTLYSQLVEYGSYAGVSEDEILFLLENGFDCWEIEEMLMEPEVVRQYIEEIAYVQGYYV